MSVTLSRLKTLSPRQSGGPSTRLAVTARLPAGNMPAGDYSICPQVFFFDSVFWMYRHASRVVVRGYAVKTFSYS